MTDFWAADPVSPKAAGGDFWASDPVAQSAPVTAQGLAQAGGIGVAKGALGVAGGFSDVNDANKYIGGLIGDKVGISPETQATLGAGYDKAARIINPLGNVLPGAATIQHAIEKATGPFREAQNVPEHYAQTAGEFLPGLLGNKGNVGLGLLKSVIAPAAASETAGQLTQGTAAEPYARIAAAVASPVAAEKIAASRAASSAAARAMPTIDQAKSAATAGFQSPEVAAVTFKPNTIEDVSNIVASDLNRSRLNDRLAPKTHAILDDMKTPVNGAAHTIEDVQTSRQLLSDHAGNFADPAEQKAATQAIKTLDKLMESMPQSRVATGDIAKANDILTEARGNYASAKTAERVSEKLRNADLQAGSTYSGGNLNNATRQKLRTLLTTKSGQRGLTPDELQSIEDTVRGSFAGNALRAGGKLLGGGGGLHMFGAGAAGGALAGPLGALALPLAGYGIKKAGDAITRANSTKIVNQILSRSPVGQQQAAAVPVTPAQRLNILRALLLSNAATAPFRMPAPSLAAP